MHASEAPTHEIIRHRRVDAEFLEEPGEEERPYYRFSCAIHGPAENYPNSGDVLKCPHCD